MSSSTLLHLLLLSSLLFSCLANVEDEFSYIEGNPNGPENWGNLKPEWETCGKGMEQSPIQLRDNRVIFDQTLGRLRRNYRAVDARLRNSGHDVLVEFKGNAGSLSINRVAYQLKRIHFHSPSEHEMNGERFDLEAQLVHESQDQKRAVVSILFRFGRADPFLSDRPAFPCLPRPEFSLRPGKHHRHHLPRQSAGIVHTDQPPTSPSIANVSPIDCQPLPHQSTGIILTDRESSTVDFICTLKEGPVRTPSLSQISSPSRTISVVAGISFQADSKPSRITEVQLDKLKVLKMDKSWMNKSRLSQEYVDGVEQFLDFAFNNSSSDNKIVCPCVKCSNVRWQTREVAFDHLACDGILQGYNCWFFHGENVPLLRTSSTNTSSTSFTSHRTTNNTSTRQDGMEELLRDAFNMQHHHDAPTFVDVHPTERMEGGNETHMGLNEEQPSEEASKFYKLLEDMNGKLYDGSKHSTLYFCIRLFHLKCMCGMTGKGLDYLIDFLKEFFPMATIPANSRESKKVIKDLGLGYEKIHSCPNDCILYWEEKDMQQSCHVCGASRWLPTNSTQPMNIDGDQVLHKRPAKVLRYFPLIPRL